MIDVELQPEKKGLVLKHWEYMVSSKVCRILLSVNKLSINQ